MLHILSTSRFVHKGHHTITQSSNKRKYFITCQSSRENHRFSLISQKYSHIANESST